MPLPLLGPLGSPCDRAGEQAESRERERSPGAKCLSPGPARAGGGEDREELSAPEVLRREKVDTGAQGGADTEELSLLRGC